MKKRFVALMMMVAMTATLVACSGKDAPKENTTAGTNDSAVEATTGTTTQDVAESNEETTTPDVSEVEENQVGETSVGTVGGSYSETTPKDTSDLFVGDGYSNIFAPDLGKTQVKIYKDDPSKGQHGIVWYPSEKWNYDGKITVCFDAYMPVDTGYLARFYKPTDTYGFETFNLANANDKEAYSKYGFDETNLTFRYLGDLSSDEAWKEQLNRDWENINIEYEDFNCNSNKNLFTQFEDTVQINNYNNKIPIYN